MNTDVGFKCLFCILKPLFFSLQGHRILTINCTKEDGKCKTKMVITVVGVVTCLFEFCFGIYISYYFLMEIIISHIYVGMLFKLKCMLFLFGILSVANSILWNINKNKFKEFIYCLCQMYNLYDVSKEQHEHIEKVVIFEAIIFWLFQIFAVLLNIFIIYFTKCKYLFLQFCISININFFLCIFYELNGILSIRKYCTLHYSSRCEKLVSVSVNDKNFKSFSTEECSENINWIRNTYTATCKIMAIMGEYMFFIFPLFFILFVLISICCISCIMDLFLYPYLQSIDEILLILILIFYGVASCFFAIHVVLKCEEIQNSVSTFF